jgi:hypothetical protein
MKSVLAAVAAVFVGLAPLAAAAAEQTPKPRYDAQGNLLRPSDYRDWEFLSAGYGMNYTPAARSHPLFTNVFVQRWAYQHFVQSGKWPEQTMFVVDERDAKSRGSINKTGRYQTELMGLAVEIKDSARNPQTWAYYRFSADSGTAIALPPGNDCEACHAAHAAVEYTFVQFYPTLKPVARKFGVYDERREQVHDLK